jgi:hypothetical protein
MENLLIEIGANTQEFLKGLTEVGEKTEDMGKRLQGIGAVAGVAFAGYTASIMTAVYAYREEEKIGQEVEAILRSTGGVAGVTAKAVEEYAESLSHATTFSKEAVARGEEILLTYTRIGKNIFPEATQATLDLAQKMGGDASSAAQLLGRALQDPMNGLGKLTRAGILFTEQQKKQIEEMELSGNVAGAQAVILRQVEAQYGGMAKAAAGGTGQIAVLKNTMEVFVQKIGSEFAPYVEMGARKLIELIRAAGEHEGLLKFIAATLTAGAAVTGAISALVAGALAWKQITSAMEVANVVMTTLGISVRGLVGATGIGLLLIVAYEVYEHWGVIWPAAQAIFKAFCDNVGRAAAGVGKILMGAFLFDIGKIKEGLAEVSKAFVDGAKQVGDSFKPRITTSAEQKESAKKAGEELGKTEAAARARALMAEEDRARKLEFAAKKAAREAEISELFHHSAQVVSLKKREAKLLSDLSKSHYAAEKTALRQALAENERELEAAEKREEKSRTKFRTQLTKESKKFNQLSASEQRRFLAAHEAELVSSMKTEADIRNEAALQELQKQIDSDNQELAEAEKFGKAYAAIHKAMRDSMLTEAQSSFDQLEQLTQSKNSTLKGIGKAAASANIAIKTAEGALAAYAGFCQIPIIGPALGIAAAGAVTAYGIEREAQVMGAAKGGLITGGIPGADSVPAMLTPGELVAPKQNFDEVVNAVADRRAGQASGPPQEVNHVITIDFKGQASQILTAQINQDKALGRYRGKQ